MADSFMKNNNKFLSNLKVLKGFILPLILMLAWDMLSRQGAGYAYTFVPIARITKTFMELIHNGELLTNLFATLHTTMIGLFVGGLIGLMLGGLMGISSTINKLIGPLYHAIRQIPLLGLIPLIALWFGNGEFSKILLVSLAACFPVVLNTYEGVRGVENKYIEVSQVLKFSRFQRLFKVLLPAAMPSIMTGFAHALAFAWVATVGSELLFSTGPGLGGLMQNAQAASRMDIVILAVISVGLTGLLMNSGLSLIRDYLLRWRSVR
jgi:sulfonate transport system permease protein